MRAEMSSTVVFEEFERVSEASHLLQEGNLILLGLLQLSFFDINLFEEEVTRSVKGKRKARNFAKGHLV
jgi:hypothetical protein